MLTELRSPKGPFLKRQLVELEEAGTYRLLKVKARVTLATATTRVTLWAIEVESNRRICWMGRISARAGCTWCRSCLLTHSLQIHHAVAVRALVAQVRREGMLRHHLKHLPWRLWIYLIRITLRNNSVGNARGALKILILRANICSGRCDQRKRDVDVAIVATAVDL